MTGKPQSLSRIPVSVFLLSALALLVRVLIVARGGLWRDEALFMFVTRSSSWSAMMDFLRFHESQPPLFYVLMRIWLSLTGDSDAAAVVLPVALGVALVSVMYFVGARLFSKSAGLLAAVLAAASPILAEHSALVRPYSLLPVLVLLSSYTLIRGIGRGERHVWAGYVVATLALLYTHNWGWLVLGGEWVAVALVLTTGILRHRSRISREWVLAQAAIAVGYLPWVSSFLYQTAHAGQVHSPSVLSASESIGIAARTFFQATLLAYPVVDQPTAFMAAKRWFFALPVIFLIADQFLRARHARADAPSAASGDDDTSRAQTRIALICLIVVPVAAWVVALLLSSRSELILPRCLAMLAPSLLLALSYWVTRPRRGAMLALSRAAVAAFIATYALTLYDLTQATSSNARELAAAVAARTKPSDLLIIAPEWLASSFNRYFVPAVEQIDYPNFAREGAVDFGGVLERVADDSAAARVERRIAEARRDGRRTWLIVRREEVQHISPEVIRALVRVPNYGVAGMGRVAQVRAALERLYGPPDSSVMTRTKAPQYEDLRAFLFSP